MRKEIRPTGVEEYTPAAASIKDDFLHAAVTGDADTLLQIIESFPLPDTWRKIAYEIARKGGHKQAADILRPTVH